MTERRSYTPEVLEALRLRGMDRPEHAQPEPVPDGHLRYHIAVEQTVLAGTAPAPVVAAALRGLADQIDHTTLRSSNG